MIELEDEKVKCCILYFDSSYSEQRKNRVCDHLRDYLEIEYKQRNFEDREINNRTIEAISVEVLQQDDTVSCGLHLILILERFLMTPLNYVDEPVSTIEWFDELDVIQKRESMAKVVETLIVACNPAMVDSIPKIQLPTLDGEIITVNSPQKTVKKFCMKENKIR